MAKVGKVFKGLFKVIFTCLSIVSGALVLGFLALDFVTCSGGVNIFGFTASTTIYASGYSLAFKGPLMGVASSGSTVSDATSLGNVGMSIGILCAFIILCLALILAIIYLVCAWGRRGADIKKFFAFGSALCFLVAGVLFFCALPLAKDALMELLKSQQSVNAFKIGSGAICSGVFSLLSALFILIAGALGPKRD